MHELSLTHTDIPGLKILDLGIQYNDAGWFKENWHREKMLALGLPDFGPVQHNITHVDSRGTLRGFLAEPWDRLVSLTRGRAFGAWVDLREGESYGRVVTHELTPAVAAFVPHGVASAHQVLEDDTTFSRLMSHHWTPQARARFSTIDPFDPALRIGWPIPRSETLTAQSQRNLPLLRDATPMKPRGVLVVGDDNALGQALLRHLPAAAGIAHDQLGDELATDWSQHHTVVNAAVGSQTRGGTGLPWGEAADLTRRLTDLARRHHLQYVHLTVDPSFARIAPTYREQDVLAMTDARDHALAVSEAVAATVPRHFIIRTTWVIDDDDHRINTWLAAARSGQLVQAAYDRHGRLTFASQLVSGIRHLLAGAPSGTYNLTGEGPTVSWADVARRVFELSGRSTADVRSVSGGGQESGSVLEVERLHDTGFKPGNSWLMLEDYLAGTSTPRDREASDAVEAAATTRRGPYKVLFVCTANICRSAYADVAARARGMPGIEFSSAGTHALVGRGIDPPIGDHVVQPGRPADHRARQLDRALVEEADLVLTMAQEHRRYILDEWPGLGRKAFVIGHAAREMATLPAEVTLEGLASYLWRHRTLDPGDEVPDPYNRGPEAAASATQLIDEHLEVILGALALLVQRSEHP